MTRKGTRVRYRSISGQIYDAVTTSEVNQAGFVAVEIETRDGESQLGLVGGETPEAVTVLQAGGTKIVIPRKAIMRMATSGQSLMPEGFERILLPADLADLIAYLRSPS